MWIDPDKCNACGLCLKDCPLEVISWHEEKARVGAGCVECRTCFRVCPKQAVVEIREDIPGAVVCTACPVNCRIAPEHSGACRRFLNRDGEVVRTRPLVSYVEIKPELSEPPSPLIREPLTTAIGAGTTYPDYIPAPYIVTAPRDDIDVVTVVTEAPLSYSGVKVKVDTDVFIGEEGAEVRFDGRPVGMVETEEYGSKMLAVGGVNRLTGKYGFAVARAVAALANRKAVELSINKGARLTVQAGQAPIVNGRSQARMRVGCGSATAGLFAPFFKKAADEVIVLDSHITSLFSHHAAGRYIDLKPTGLGLGFPLSTPGRYFGDQGAGWGGTSIVRPLDIVTLVDVSQTPAGTRLLITETTGEKAAYFTFDPERGFVETDMPPEALEAVRAIRETCQPSRVSVLYAGGTGGSARAGVTRYPLKLTRAVHENKAVLTVGGASVFLLPGGGITFYVDVEQVRAGAFSWTPTPAIIAPIEYTMLLKDYEKMGGHVEAVKPFSKIRGAVFRGKGLKVE